MLTEKDYCDYDTCVALEELGYPRYHYDNGGELDKILRMVTLYNAQKWLREEKRICVEVDSCAGGYVWELCKAYHTDWFSGGTTIYTEEDPNNPLLNDCGKYDSFEVALLEGIKHAVKILKGE